VLERVSVRGVIEDVDLVAPPGQIIGLAGLVGAGHHACIELVAGLRRPDQGRVLLPGGKPAPHGLPKAIDAGVALASGDRRRYGLMLDKPVWENVGQVRSVALARDGTFIRSMKLRVRAREHIERLRVRTPSVEEQTGLLSGGNQQKVVLAKWLDASPSVLLLDDPTRGVDVGAKAEMHALIRAIADAGAVVLLCSTDIDELVDVCDRVVVFHRGRICVEISHEELNSHEVLEAMNTGSPAVARMEAERAV
jgi:ribose transport system ATP-binding protein/rhamnose transport system ATP-binding protein